MRAFRRTSRGLEAWVDEGERHVLRGLAGELLALLDDDVASAGDAVLARFFPDAYGDDVDAAEEFRSLTEADLRDAKRVAAATFVESLAGPAGSLVLDVETAETWLLTLNDLRLAIGTRLDIQEDTLDLLADGRLGDLDDDVLAAYEVYEVLGLLQESLVHALAEAPAS